MLKLCKIDFGNHTDISCTQIQLVSEDLMQEYLDLIIEPAFEAGTIFEVNYGKVEEYMRFEYMTECVHFYDLTEEQIKHYQDVFGDRIADREYSGFGYSPNLYQIIKSLQDMLYGRRDENGELECI